MYLLVSVFMNFLVLRLNASTANVKHKLDYAVVKLVSSLWSKHFPENSFERLEDFIAKNGYPGMTVFSPFSFSFGIYAAS